MAHVNLLVYLIMCPFNVRHILDAPSFPFRLRSKTAKGETFMYGATGRENRGNSFSRHDEMYMLDLAKIYYQIVLKYKRDVRQGQEENYDLVVSSFGKEANMMGISLQRVRVTNDAVYLSYQKVQNGRNERNGRDESNEPNERNEHPIQVKINRGEEISTYLDLLRLNSCLYKLNSDDYNFMKRASDHSKPIMISTYHIYILLIVFSLCTYVEKSLLLHIPALKKCQVFLTLCLVFFPIISYLFFFYTYASLFGVLLLYVLFYFLFWNLSCRRRGEGLGQHTGHWKMDRDNLEELDTQQERRQKCLVHMRIANLCITYICIFAVDFYFFPRQFSKSFFFGNTLMDLGVGGCITSSAYSLNRRKLIHSANLRGRIIDWKHFILFSLGIARYIAVKLFNYSYSLTEYGMHWNFFLTLFFTFLICNAVLTLIKGVRRIFLLSCVLICVYEFVIWHLDLTNYLLADDTERTHFFSLNREGLMNVIGSVNLYLFSFSLWNGYVLQDEVHQDEVPQGKRAQWQRYAHLSPVCLTLKLFTMSLLFHLLHLLLNYYRNYSVRILCNANYICVISSVSLFAASLSYFVEAILLREKTTTIPVLQKMNRHSLAVFLFCNITMGAFNLLFQSLLFPLFFACIVLAAYSYGMLRFASMLPGPAERERAKQKEKHY
ncbi:hypothetical protein C922_00867 [Plasmodium inui San Antonio 1]|uniref:GPI-anchored wall transfer protein 1 n=1 Tax=Plasmodium inui San Antonio 1 TaxID=1237626 RepID=W7ASM4_9APIC|nr:hypothetical protein C922_00867 [Plasmodium inui San Antonio 1]EUD68471.1 hypothetical protein C922_00867 [Plasmodium inui San Antonio 1]